MRICKYIAKLMRKLIIIKILSGILFPDSHAYGVFAHYTNSPAMHMASMNDAKVIALVHIATLN